MRIGIIDSGKGGLAVAKKIQSNENQSILLMDRGFFPYGKKSKEVLLKRAYYLVTFLLNKKVDMIVIACNTLSILALPFLKNCFKLPILGVFDYFLPYFSANHVLIGSKTTITYALQHYGVDVIDGTEFIDAIENDRDLTPFLSALKNVKTELLLLGCTHFLMVPAWRYPIPAFDQIKLLKKDIKKLEKTLALRMDDELA